jgi:hypothetical protein
MNIHNNLWQFLFNLIGKINRDGYSSLIEIYILLNEILSRLSLEGKRQYLTEYIVYFKA